MTCSQQDLVLSSISFILGKEQSSLQSNALWETEVPEGPGAERRKSSEYKLSFRRGGGQLRESIWSKINNAVPFSRQTKSVECGAVLFGICPLFFISLHPPENWEALPLTPHQSSWGPPNAWESSVHLNVVHQPILNNRWPPHEQTSKVSHLVVSTSYLADNVFP